MRPKGAADWGGFSDGTQGIGGGTAGMDYRWPWIQQPWVISDHGTSGCGSLAAARAPLTHEAAAHEGRVQLDLGWPGVHGRREQPA